MNNKRKKKTKKKKKKRRGSVGRKEREAFPVPYTGNGSKDSKWWSPTLSFILESWGNISGQR
jgi:hypothetical protein